MNRVTVWAIALSLALSAAGCFRTTLKFHPRPGAGMPARLRRSFIIGLAELDGPINVEALCPRGVAHVEQRYDIVGILLAMISFGIVEARKVEVWCLGKR